MSNEVLKVLRDIKSLLYIIMVVAVSLAPIVVGISINIAKIANK